MPVNELHQSHYLGERLFDSSQELICRLALMLIVEESVLYIRGPVQRRFGRLQLHDRFSLFH